jgi:signal transduction histidine kinase
VPTDDGLDRFDPSTGTFKVYRADWNNRGTQSYISLAEDEGGALWLCTRNSGLQRLEPATERFTVFKANPSDSRSLRDNMVSGVQPDGSSALWVSTFNGLQRLDRSTGTFISYDERDGLSGNAISCMLNDSHGDLWMSTNRGISNFHPPTRTFKNYSVADGLPGDDLTGWEACFKSPDGEMFFGGFAGAVAFRPESLRESSYAPAISLTELRLSGSVVGVEEDSPLRTSISYTDRLNLTHEQSAFSLTFSALSYLSATDNRYRYKLEGLDNTWHEVGSDDRMAAYTTLPAGRYTFRAQAATRRGPWGEPGLTLPIEILPRFWETAWFPIAGYGLIGISLWTLYRARLSQIGRNYTIRLDERIAERNRIARELHDTLLQGIQGLMWSFQAAAAQIPVGEPARQLMESALDRADEVIVEGRDRVKGLRTTEEKYGDLSETFAMMSTELAAEHAIPFQIILQGIPRDLNPIVWDDAYQIGREALINAFHHSLAQKIETEITFARTELRLRFRDDGCGVDSKILEHGGRPGHWGMTGMRERARKIGARLDIWSRHGNGTEVDVRIPASIAYRGGVKGWRWPWSGYAASEGNNS